MKHLILVFTLLFLAVFFTACVGVPEEIAEPLRLPTITPTTTVTLVEEKIDSIQLEEYQVYSAVLEYLITDFFAYFDIQQFVIKNTTIFEIAGGSIVDSLDYVSENIPVIDLPTMQDFREKNEEIYCLKSELTVEADYVIKSDNELGEDSSDLFISSYVLVSFSRVGFNSDRDQALVYFEYYCGFLCGAGFYVYLVIEGDDWIIEDMVRIWIS